MMLTKRIVPCLDIKDGRTVKGVNFVDLRDAGDPIELAERYAKEGADELVFLDISATEQKRKTLAEMVYPVAEKLNIPFTVGGGISSVEDVDILPIIASGGAGSIKHFVDTFTDGKADAALAASVFHFKEIEILDLKNELKKEGIPVRI